MAVYNLKRELKLYIVRNGLRYALDIYPDISFSQTLSETAVPVKTLHTQKNMFEQAVITKANPANFNFTVPVLRETDLDIALSMLLDYDDASSEATVTSADLYVEMNSEIYKLEKAVMQSGVFSITRNELMVINFSGTAKRLTKFTGAYPGVLQARSATTTYNAPNVLTVTLGGVVQTNINSLSVEVKNNVTWIDYTTLQNSLAIQDASGTQVPEAFVVTNRVLSGNLQQYTTDTTAGLPTDWSTTTSLRIQAGNTLSAMVLDINIPSIVYTKRIDLQDFMMQSFDWRMNYNPAKLSDVVQHLHL